MFYLYKATSARCKALWKLTGLEHPHLVQLFSCSRAELQPPISSTVRQDEVRRPLGLVGLTQQSQSCNSETECNSRARKKKKGNKILQRFFFFLCAHPKLNHHHSNIISLATLTQGLSCWTLMYLHSWSRALSHYKMASTRESTIRTSKASGTSAAVKAVPPVHLIELQYQAYLTRAMWRHWGIIRGVMACSMSTAISLGSLLLPGKPGSCLPASLATCSTRELHQSA